MKLECCLQVTQAALPGRCAPGSASFGASRTSLDDFPECLGHRRRLGHVRPINAAVDLDFRRMELFGRRRRAIRQKPADVDPASPTFQWALQQLRRRSASAFAGASACSRSARSLGPDAVAAEGPDDARLLADEVRGARHLAEVARHVCFACSMTQTWATVRSS